MPTTVLSDYHHRMGGHCGSGALRDLMQWYELGWDGPPGEGLVFALGGALDFSYVRSDGLTPPIYLVGRGSDLELDLIRRLGGRADLKSTDDPSLGWQWVRDRIDYGAPVLAWADIAELPYLRVRLRMSRHDIVIIGYDDNDQVAHVVDNDRAEVQLVPYDALARARSSTSFPEPTRHTIYDITWPDELPDLRGVAADAFAHSAAAMAVSTRPTLGASEPIITGTGLAAVTAFVKDLRQWPGVFDEATLDISHRSLAAFIEKAGTGGGLFRRLLAEGTADINRLLEDRATADVAAAAAAAATAWTAVAAAAATPTTDVRERHDAVVTQTEELCDLETALYQSLLFAAAELRGPRPNTAHIGA